MVDDYFPALFDNGRRERTDTRHFAGWGVEKEKGRVLKSLISSSSSSPLLLGAVTRGHILREVRNESEGGNSSWVIKNKCGKEGEREGGGGERGLGRGGIGRVS